MSKVASNIGIGPRNPISYYSAAQFLPNLRDTAIAMVVLTLRALIVCRLLAYTCYFKEHHKKRLVGLNRTILVANTRHLCGRYHTWKSFLQNVHRSVRCMACSAILQEPHAIYIYTDFIQFGPK